MTSGAGIVNIFFNEGNYEHNDHVLVRVVHLKFIKFIKNIKCIYKSKKKRIHVYVMYTLICDVYNEDSIMLAMFLRVKVNKTNTRQTAAVLQSIRAPA